MLKRFFIHSVLLSVFILPQLAIAEEVTTTNIPWSGYWWPHYEGALVTGANYYDHPAPLEKYDLLFNSYTVSTWYKNSVYDPTAPGWYGHCLAWSKAAMSEKYPILPSSEDNIIFRVGDKKGLLTLGHNADLYELGTGDPNSFHYWLLTYIKDQQTPFIIDLDTSSEKWYYPIYKYDMHSSIRGNTEAVSVTVTYASNFVHPDFQGTENKTANFTYDLELDDDGSITGGHWTGDSVTNHPDLLFFPLSQQTDAPGLEYQKIQQIAKNKDDFLEQGTATVALAPGTYNLVLLDQDNYSLTAAAGEQFSFTLEKLAGSSKPLTLLIRDGNGQETSNTLSKSGETITLNVDESQPTPYTFSLTQDDYLDPNLYTITILQHKGYIQHLPYLPKNKAWLGFAVTNNSAEAIDNVVLTTHDENGTPLHTVWGPLSLGAHEKKSFLFDSLPYRKHELIKSKGLTLQADQELQLVSLIGLDKGPVASMVQNGASGEHIVLPLTNKTNNINNILYSYIINNSLTNNSLNINIFTADGVLKEVIEQELLPHQLLTIKPGQGLFDSLPENGWMDIISKNGQAVTGFSYHRHTDDASGLFALPVRDSTKYIPHIPQPGNWTSAVTFINTSDTDNLIRLHLSRAKSDSRDVVLLLTPHKKQTLSLDTSFALFPGDALYHSTVEITGTQDFVGHFSYQMKNGKEKVSYPLMDSSQFTDTLTLPHYPGKENWWTGVAIANPLHSVQRVMVSAYDSEGNRVGENREIDVQAGGYELFTIESLFDLKSGQDISFVSAQTTTPGGVICGIYLYGSKKANSLSGGLM